MDQAAIAQRFVELDPVGRAVILLTEVFREPETAVSRQNVADGIANALDRGSRGVVGASRVVGARGGTDPEMLRLVSEAWQVLEQARLICRDLSQPVGDWWILTASGRSARDTDPEGAIQLGLQGAR